MARVLNRHHPGIPKDAILITRETPYGNPFKIPRDGNRQQVIKKFTAWIQTQPKLIERIKRELKDKDLICCCKPAACHGDIILALANGETLSQLDTDKSKRQVQHELFNTKG